MYSRILVPVDGSSLSEQVLPYVQQLGLGLSIPVTLMTVVEPSPPSIGLHLGASSQEQETVRHRADHAITYLDSLADAFRSDGVTVSTLTRSGAPAQEIVQEAEREADTLIAMSGHGRSGVARWWLGSVADRVLHTAGSPLLLIRFHDDERSTHAQGFSRVVVPVDGSPLAEEILPHVAHITKALGMAVDLVRVVPTWSEYLAMAAPSANFGTASLDTTSLDEAFRYNEEESNRYLDRVREDLLQQGVGLVETHCLRGDPASSIIDVATETPDRLVAMTTHGRSGVGRWVLGSVADRVVRNSGDPVLVVRAGERRPLQGESMPTVA